MVCVLKKVIVPVYIVLELKFFLKILIRFFLKIFICYVLLKCVKS